MIVRFPIYFEVCGYGELELPDDVDPDDEDAVKQFIADQWDDVPLPEMEDVEFVDGTCEFDWNCCVEIDGVWQ